VDYIILVAVLDCIKHLLNAVAANTSYCVIISLEVDTFFDKKSTSTCEKWSEIQETAQNVPSIARRALYWPSRALKSSSLGDN